MKSKRNILISMLMTLVMLGGCETTGNNIEPSRDPKKSARLNMELGLAYMENKNNKKALTRLKKAIKIDPQYSDAHNAIAILYSRLREDELAGDHYEKAIRFEPNNAGALNNYGQYLCSHDQAEKAQTMFKRALANPLYTTPQFAYINAGLCAKSSKDYKLADINFRGALKQDPYMAAALYQMADLSHTLQRNQPAKKYIQRLLDTGRQSAKYLWLAVRVAQASGDLDAEASYALRLKNNFPDSQETRLLLEMENK